MADAVAHSDRAHDTWSASATSRNWECSGALALSAQVEYLDVESEAAAWGTACHELSEKCLRTGLDAADRIGETIKTKSHSFDVDEEMAACAQEYIDYVRERRQTGGGSLTGPAATLYIEQRFSLEKLNPPFDAGGTADAVIYNPAEKLLEVIDLKGGRGVVVEVTENKQLRTYALGAMLANPGLAVERVMSTIVQPRAPHKDGRIRSETFHVVDLMEWTGDLRQKMALSKHAQDELADVKGELMLEAWSDKWLRAGDHCTFCPAAGNCKALEKKALAVADAWFDDSGRLQIQNQPDVLSPARLADKLDGFDLLQNWMNAGRALAARLAEGGTEIANPETGARYVLVDKIGHRKFKDTEVHAELVQLGLGEDDIFEQKMRSPAQIEKKLGGAKRKREIIKRNGVEKTREEWFDDLVHRPVTGRSLVSAAKTTREAVPSKAEAFFS